ncbi:MAG: hypothetical protein LBH43_11080, partial [Treponema sp.]|nr:hypothetical protein [Treponema sp.]
MQNRSNSCHYCPLRTTAMHLHARALRRARLIAGFLAAVAMLFTTCDSPLGFGKPIDWEPPELTLDTMPNPLYVRNGTKLTGTVRDNVAVDRVVLTNARTGEELLKAVIDGERWEIDLVFTEEQNGEKILAQISAYDTAGNCGANSIAFITLIIDIRPPIIEYISIQRTNTRIAFLEPLAKLKELEITDPRGEKKDNLYKYQNGWFHINGIVSDEETKIEVAALKIYDTREINTVLLSIPCDEGYTAYFPRWTVKEDDIIAAGVEKWGQDYKTNYYVNGERYYYRIVIEATDSSENTSVNIEEDEGYICMWARSDDPKGILDPGTRTVVPRGTPLPIDFFDDDSLEWAYAGLLTENQWHGMNDIYPGTRIPAGDDDQKLDWLRGKLLNGDTIYNWRYEKHAGKSDEIEPITEQINGKNLDEKLVYVQTGDQESDYGEYVLFTLASDRKLPPHDGTGPERTNQNIWAGKVWRISLVDENIPLIVFDTKNGCPEENTFPPLANGQSFEIIGYTMRENASGDNKVTTFRMAWIPFEMDGGADSYISDVRKALSANNYPSSIDNDTALNGIQHWEFVETNPLPPGYGLFGPNTNDDVTIPGSVYYQQEFRKTFNILGGKDDIKNVYNNFTYKGKLENETKLFVFYAMDNRGHEVFRQLRLLGMKTPPNLVVYDITNKLGNALLPGLPDPNNSLYINNATGGLNQAYYTALNSYNNTVYSQLKGAASGLTEGDKTIPFQVYPRETKLKYWIKAAENGEIAVDSISMKDISFTGDAQTVGSGYKDADEAYSFCEYYPDVTQRTFLFEAIDKLGNKVQIQRTIAITNAARLVNITTLEENGTYGIGKKINLKANFSSQIYVEGGTPSLNVRYHMKNGSWVYTQLPCSNTPSNGSPTLALEFNFDVPEGSDNRLETMFETIGILPPSQEKRPIVLNSATKIMDYFRMDAAFIPGYANESVIMPNWTTAANSLQEKKEITLDGIRPTITGVSIGGKTAYTDNNYYFKEGETIEVALSADKPIRASDTPVPRLQYFIRDSGGTDRGPYNTAFTYSRPNGSSALVFSLPVNGANCPYDGELRNVSLVLGTGTIMDNVDNEVNAAAIPVPTSRIFIKKTLPPAPVATLNGTPFGTAAANFTVNVVLAIPLPPTASDYPGVTWNDNKRQYSTNGGLAWLDYSAPVTINRDGAYD